jgi:hypothetical protein
MNTEELKQYFATHHPEGYLLHQLPWLVFGHVSFSKEISHDKKSTPRIRRFAGLMTALAIACEVKAKKLVFFQNTETKPELDFHHVHFLLGPQNLEKFPAEEICQRLSEKATEFGFGQCAFLPYDPSKDGVGYITKRVYRTLSNGQRQEIPPDFFMSAALKHLLKQKGLL